MMNKATIKHIIGFSGGLASAVTAHIIAEQYPDDTILLFHDTKTEPADNDRFRAEVAEYMGLSITEDSDGRNIWEIFRDEGFLGNGRNTPCSRILKQGRSMQFVLNHQPAILYIGFTLEEWSRAQRTYSRYGHKGVDVKFPLIKRKITKAECHNRVEKCWGIKPPALYKWAEHANCIPCIKGKKAYWGLIYKFEREAWEKASNAEKEFGHTIFTEAGSLEEELDNCLRLADKYLKKRSQMSLIQYPCECAA
jgi:3'-phosphoadenosine 5'-phosphosulfate sulfotransferase (PAPS reductase)/FAD synthetase